MTTKEKILELLKSKKSKPMTRQEVARHFRVSGREKNKLYDLLSRLEREGEVIRVKGGRYALPRELGLVVGRLEVNPRGFGFVISEKREGEDIYIHSEDMSTALHGDKVLVRILKERHRRRGRLSHSGQVVRILERKREKMVGTLSKTGTILYLIPDNPSFIHNIYINPSHTRGARPGQKVVVRIINWPSRHLSPEGEVVEVLGEAGLPQVDTRAVIVQYELREEYPDPVLKEAKETPQRVTPGETRGREDLRNKIVFTVDPDDARDFDDAVSLEKTEEGNWLLGVHISDVSHYLKEGTVLDGEAQKRGTSVYFPARVLHMLPPSLSTGICSLKPREERLTLSVFLTFSPRGKRLSYRFTPSVIRSQRRFTYGEVRKFVVEKDKAARKSEPVLAEVLDKMGQLSGLLRKARFARGALDLELPEAKIIFDPEGRITEVRLEEQDLAHSIIEEFMLAANEAVAEFLSRKKAPVIYRVHDRPDDRDLKEFIQFAVAFGFKIKNPKDRQEVQSFLDSVKESPLGAILQTAFLRSLKQAEYSDENIGHFGLNSSCYAYFTSPIRRYPDLHNHRLLKQILKGEKPPLSPELNELALHCSETEEAAEEAEREVLLLRKLQFFQQQLAEGESDVFNAVITRVKNFGLGVYLNRYLIGGLIHVSTLTDDFYRSDRSGTVLKGRRTKRQFRIGDVIKIRVEKVDLVKREVDFRIFPEEKF